MSGRGKVRSRRLPQAASVSISLLFLAIVAGCGVGEDQQAACVRDFAAGVQNAQPRIPAHAAEEAGRRVCSEAEAQGLLESDDASAFATLVRQSPEVLYPICAARLEQEFGFTSSRLEALGLRKDMDRFARNYCEQAIAAGFLELGRPPGPEEVERLMTSNPDLGSQACFLGAMTAFDEEPLFLGEGEASLSTTKKFSRRYCREATSRGLVDWAGDGLTPKQTRQLAALCQQIAREMTTPCSAQ